MSKILDLPKLSPTMEEGVLAKWFKKPGDSFEVDDLLAEVETDKATMEFRAFEKGVILKLLVEEGVVVKLGGQLAIIGAAGESLPEEVAKPVIPQTSNTESQPKPELNVKDESSKKSNDLESLIRTQILLEDVKENYLNNGSVIASPRVRKEAREKNINLINIKGSGNNGRILIEDLVNKDIPSRNETKNEDVVSEKVQLSQMRKTIAKRLTQSKRDVPHFYLTTEINVSKLLDARSEIIKSIDDKDIKPTINDFIIMASSKSLRLNMNCNVSFDDDFIIKHKQINTSVAVAIPDGLVTPVIRNSDKLSVIEIHKEVKRLAELAKNKKLKLEEMQGGTYSVSNLGSYGVSEFSAVINPPEGFILAVGSASENKIMKITMSCDHRVIDGAVGATYLKDLKRLLENPILMLV